MNKQLLKDSLAYADKWLNFQFQQQRIPGFAVAVQHGNDIIYSKTFGVASLDSGQPLTSDHLYRVASQSKIFTATAIMLLVEDGKLRLDDKVSKQLPWFKSNLDTDVKDVTIRQILCHSSGIVRDGEDANYWEGDSEFPTEADLKRFIQRSKLVQPSNEGFKYSNFGYGYLGIVVAAASKQTYDQFIQTRIVDKLGLKCTSTDLSDSNEKLLATGYTSDVLKTVRRAYRHQRTNALASATGFVSTPVDMCRFAAAHYMGATMLLTDASKREMQRIQWRSEVDREDYGLGLELRSIGSRKVIGHGGGFPGFITNTTIDPKEKLTVSVCTTAITGPAWSIATGIFKIINYFQNEGTKSPDKKFDASKYEGRFFASWGVDDFVKVGKQLVVVNPNTWEPFDVTTKLSYLSGNEFKIKESSGFGSPGEKIQFHFEDEQIDHITYAGFHEYPWETYKELHNIVSEHS